MNKKEKALKLVQEYGMLGMKWEQTEYTTLDLENAKECAIIHVTGIIKVLINGMDADYWKDVKKEISKL